MNRISTFFRSNFNKAILIISIFFVNFLALESEQPEIKWWFDVKDSSFGQSAAGDIDNDGKLELVFGCYRNDSCVYALNSEDGTLLWKYNTSISADGCNDVAPIIYDVDGDGSNEVIVPSSCTASTYCFDGKTGAVKWIAPTRGSDSPPTIGDIDNDGKLEILHGEFGGYVICINAENGKIKWEIAVDLNSWIQTAPTIADINNDGQLDFVVATWNSVKSDTNKVYAYNGKNQKLLWTFPLNNVVYHGSAISDIDNDGKVEILIGDYSGELFAINGEDGSKLWSYKLSQGFYNGGPISLADIDADGICEIVYISWYKVIALRTDGTLFWEYSIPEYSSSFRGPALSDIDNDSKPDVIFGTMEGNVIALKGTNGISIWTINLAEHIEKEFDINHAPIIADFDSDGKLDLFIVGGYTQYPEFQKNYGRAYCLSIGVGSGPDWLMFQNNISRNSVICNKPTTVIDYETTPKDSIISFNLNSKILTVEFYLNNSENVEIVVFDILGNEIIKIRDRNFNLGINSISLNLEESFNVWNYSGLYLLKMKIGNKINLSRTFILKN